MAKTKNVLVVGGAGYIGSHVCKELALQGYQPVCYDNLVYGHEWAVKWGPFEQGDINDRERLCAVMTRYAPVGVIHLAAFAYVGESVTEPEKYYRNNVAGTLTLLEAMRSSSIENIVFSSTCAVYGIPKSVPITENQQLLPVNPYGWTKMMVERMLADFHRAYNLHYVALRYFNAAGADPDGEVGEAHDPETHLLPLALDVAAGKREQLHVFGSTYPTKDGTCIRDYIHVKDLARAHVCALRKLEEQQIAALSVNLGTGNGYSIYEVIVATEKVTGKSVAYTVDGIREGDPPVLVADPAEAAKQLGWIAEFKEIEPILQHAWNFHQKRDQRL